MYLFVILTWNATSFPILQTLVSEKKGWRLNVGLLLVTSTYLTLFTISSGLCKHFTQQKIVTWQVSSMFVLVSFISKLLQFFSLNTVLGAWVEKLWKIYLIHIVCASRSIHQEAHWNYQQAHSIATLKKVKYSQCVTFQLNRWWLLISCFQLKMFDGRNNNNYKLFINSYPTPKKIFCSYFTKINRLTIFN